MAQIFSINLISLFAMVLAVTMGGTSSAEPLPDPSDYSYSGLVLNYILSLPVRGPESEHLSQAERELVHTYVDEGELEQAFISDAARLASPNESILRADTCLMAGPSHWSTLVAPLLNLPESDYVGGKTNLISLSGLGVVGALKYCGERSFLALKNIVNSRGHLVLVRGAIYRIGFASFKSALGHYRRRTQMRFQKLNIEELVVEPVRLMDRFEIHNILSGEISGVEDLPEPQQWRELTSRLALASRRIDGCSVYLRRLRRLPFRSQL